jgi:hypothetical protein
VSTFERFSSLLGSKLLLPQVRGSLRQPKRGTSWQTSAFIVQWEALHRILGDISTRRVHIPRFSLREKSSHFAAIALVPTRVPIGFCKRSRLDDGALIDLNPDFKHLRISEADLARQLNRSVRCPASCSTPNENRPPYLL